MRCLQYVPLNTFGDRMEHLIAIYITTGIMIGTVVEVNIPIKNLTRTKIVIIMSILWLPLMIKYGRIT